MDRPDKEKPSACRQAPAGRRRGGLRPGAGRRPLAAARLDAVLTLRVSAGQKRVFRTLGGSRWLRALLDEAAAAHPGMPEALPPVAVRGDSALFLRDADARLEPASWSAILNPKPLEAGKGPVAPEAGAPAGEFLALRCRAQALEDAPAQDGAPNAHEDFALFLVEPLGGQRPREGERLLARTEGGFLIGGARALAHGAHERQVEILGRVRAVVALQL